MIQIISPLLPCPPAPLRPICIKLKVKRYQCWIIRRDWYIN